MAEEYCGGANWWDSSSASRTRFDGGRGGGGSSTSSSTTTLANGAGGCGYGWLTEHSPMAADINAAARSSLDSVPAASGFQDTTKMDATALQLAGLGLSFQGMDWNQQPLLRNPEKADNSFRAMLQEGIGLNPNFQHESGGSAMYGSQLHKLFGAAANEDSSEFKQIAGRGFSLNHQPQPQFSPSCSSMESTVTCQQQQGLSASSFQLDSTSSSTIYGSPPSGILQGFLGSDQQNPQNNSLGMDHNQQPQLPSSWAKVPQFLRSSPSGHFTNTTAVAPYLSADVRPNFLASLQSEVAMPVFEEKPKLQNTMEVRDTSSKVAKKGGGPENNTATKRVRNETATSALPPFKVRKEKMGDRITALQQLVSPFGKTDTASVLSEAIEYIKFLHEQVSVLSTPYLKGGAASYQQPQQQGGDKAKVDPNGPKQDLRSRGLCLVPVSSTFPVTHETTVDFWTPTFGGTFR